MKARLAGAAVALVVTTTACGSTTNGHGAEPTDSAVTTATTHDFPVQSAGPSALSTTGTPITGGTDRAATPSSAPSLPPPTKTVTVEGTTTGRRITGDIYASDTLATCAGHAYGGPMISFLREHDCLGAHRVLSTVVVNGRLAVLSAVDASFRPIGNDPYAATGQFVKLERADDTGSIDDLLREGHPIPGIASRIPAHEVFQVIAQDNSATVLDAWYVTGSTSDDDSALKDLETDVFLTTLS